MGSAALLDVMNDFLSEPKSPTEVVQAKFISLYKHPPVPLLYVASPPTPRAAVAVHITCMTTCPEVEDRIASQHTLQEGYANKVFVCL